MDFNTRAHAAQRAAGLGLNSRRVGGIHRLARRPQLAASHERGRAQRMSMRERARTRRYPKSVSGVYDVAG